MQESKFKMKKLLFIFFLTGLIIHGWAQYQVSIPRTWNKYPVEVQKRGFGLYMSQLAQMDDDPAQEEILLFSADYGHYPYFDLFRYYYVIIDNYSKETKYISDIIVSTERILVLEDRNNDGKYELYRRYFQNGQFTVDEHGNNLSVVWIYDRIEWLVKEGWRK